MFAKKIYVVFKARQIFYYDICHYVSHSEVENDFIFRISCQANRILGGILSASPTFLGSQTLLDTMSNYLLFSNVSINII